MSLVEVVLAHPLEAAVAIQLGLERRPYDLNERLSVSANLAASLDRRGLLMRAAVGNPTVGIPAGTIIYGPDGNPLPIRHRLAFDGAVSVVDDPVLGASRVTVTSDGAGAVKSVNGEVGKVFLSAADVGAEPLGAAQEVAESLLLAPDPFPQYLTAARAASVVGGVGSDVPAPAQTLRHSTTWPNRSATAAPVLWVGDEPDLALPPTRLPGDVVVGYTAAAVPAAVDYVVRQDFDSANPSGTSISAINSAGLGNTPFDALVMIAGGTIVYDAEHLLPGRATSGRIDIPGDGAAAYGRLAFAPAGTLAGRVYVHLTSYPPASVDIVDLLGGASSNVRVGAVRILPGGHLAVLNGATQVAVTATSIPLGTWVRVTWTVVASSTGAGQLRVSFFVAEETTGEVEALSAATLTTASATVGAVHLGVVTPVTTSAGGTSTATIDVPSFTVAHPDNGASTTEVPAPSGVSSGDLLVAIHFADMDALDAQMTAPAGWTQAGVTFENASGKGKVWWRVAGPAEPAAYTFGAAYDAAESITILRVTGADTAAPFDAAPVWATGPSGTASHAAPSVTTTVDGALLISGWHMISTESPNTWTAPSGMTVDGPLEPPVKYTSDLVAHELLGASAATGTRTALSSYATSAFADMAVSMAFAPLVTVTPPLDAPSAIWMAGAAVMEGTTAPTAITAEPVNDGMITSTSRVVASVPRDQPTSVDPDPTPLPLVTGEPVFMTTAETSWLAHEGNGWDNAVLIVDLLKSGMLTPDLADPNNRTGAVALTGALFWLATGRTDVALREAVRGYILAAPGSAPMTADPLGSFRAVGSLLAAVDVLAKGGSWSDNDTLPNLGGIPFWEWLADLETRVLGTADPRWRTITDAATGDPSSRGAAARYALTMIGVLRDDDALVVRSVDLFRRYLGDQSKGAPFVADTASVAPTVPYDALAGRARKRLQQLVDWATANNTNVSIADIRIPSSNDGPLWDSRWEDAWEAWWNLADTKHVDVTAGVASSSSTSQMNLYRDAGGATLGTVTSAGIIFERHLAQADRRGVVLSGPEAGYLANGWDLPTRPGVEGIDYHYPAAGTWTYLASRGVTFVRLPVRWERLQPNLEQTFDATEVSLLTQALTDAHAAGIKVLVDLWNFGGYCHTAGQHILLGASIPAGHGTGALTDAFLAFWQQFATTFRDHPGLGGYGLMHSPYGLPSSTWTDGTPLTGTTTWQRASEAAAVAIRLIDPTGAIYVSGYGGASIGYWSSTNGNTAWLYEFIDGRPLSQDPHVYFEAKATLDADGSYASSYEVERTAAVLGRNVGGSYPLLSSTGTEGYRESWDNTQSAPSHVNSGLGFHDQIHPGLDGVPIVDVARSGSDYDRTVAFFGAFGQGMSFPLIAAEYVWAHTAVLRHLGYPVHAWSSNAVVRMGDWLARAKTPQSNLTLYQTQEAADLIWRGHRHIANWMRGGGIHYGAPVPTAAGVQGLMFAIPVADWIAGPGSQWLRGATELEGTWRATHPHPSETLYPGTTLYPEGA